LEPYELDIIIWEYQSDTTHLSFEAFENEFKEYQQAGQTVHMPLIYSEY